MEHLEDELDLRYHKGLNPEVYYRCPTLESLEGALRNELEKSASSFIPTDVATEFVFATASTITIPVTQQHSLDALIQAADYPQSIAVEYALCREIDGKDRLKAQRAIARSIIEAIQETDGFKYSERSAQNKEGGDGARLRYVCQDSLQNRDRKRNMKKEKSQDSDDNETGVKKRWHTLMPTYDCGGAIHLKFSLKRGAINVVYKHNPIHTTRQNGDSLPALVTGDGPPPPESTNVMKTRKRQRNKKDEIVVENEFKVPDLDMSTSLEAPKSSVKKKRKKNGPAAPLESNQKTSAKKSSKSKQLASPTKSRKKALISEPSTPPRSVEARACIRCREKKIKCNEAKPACNQCQRGLWTCQYEVAGDKKRSKTGCLNCKQRRRKCTEERPSCAHCVRLDDVCEYADYS
ncbi:hypothetical protein BDW02DRAFT_572220 [Decorospora gaudefroyi]|uniref:Zn(2)-C6 fungal-type domain-containing protein n=1 Tax=Decorospora gaudefroyi TaxID=184978 RepID=A0A6A5K4J4_9PLEO|nr:hypothetical protein BDW02DRAFT_572220 [Decorospora gaudefroyi]